MPASRLAIKLTGMSEEELREYGIPRVTSRRRINLLPGTRPRSVRVAAGLISTAEDVEAQRQLLLKDPRILLRVRRRVARKRLLAVKPN